MMNRDDAVEALTKAIDDAGKGDLAIAVAGAFARHYRADDVDQMDEAIQGVARTLNLSLGAAPSGVPESAWTRLALELLASVHVDYLEVLNEIMEDDAAEAAMERHERYLSETDDR